MKKFEFLCFLALVACGCDSSGRLDLLKEREGGHYSAAMADYQAGRLDAALAGFEKAVAADPANASARFQLACLLHDVKKDYLGAFCAYREYLRQHPKSDKTSVVSTRLATCERELAIGLAAKYKIDGGEHLKTIETLRKELKDVNQRLATSETELRTARSRMTTLSEERDRLVAAVKGVGVIDDQDLAGPAVSTQAVIAAKDLLDEEDTDSGDHSEEKKEIASLKADEKEESQESSLLLPKQSPDAKAKRDKLEAELKQAKLAAVERERRRHPPEYVVQEGDTLYRLAERFYGKISAWKTIRDANKAVISNDGRLKTGTKLTLPYVNDPMGGATK